MSKRSHIIAGLEILEKYDPDGWCDAQHDILYGCPFDPKISEEDQEALKGLGWFLDEETESWAIFT